MRPKVLVYTLVPAPPRGVALVLKVLVHAALRHSCMRRKAPVPAPALWRRPRS
jgi:hypothetical protein